MANGDNTNDWKYYAIRFAFGIVALLLPITIGLAALTYSNLKEENLKVALSHKESFGELKGLLTKQTDKVDDLCKKVDRHDTLLRIPWNQRKEFYTLPKHDSGEK